MQTRLIVAAVIQIMVFVEILSEGLVNSIPQLLKTALIHLVDCISNHAYAIRYNLRAQCQRRKIPATGLRTIQA